MSRPAHRTTRSAAALALLAATAAPALAHPVNGTHLNHAHDASGLMLAAGLAAIVTALGLALVRRTARAAR
jgi:hypothetical protein